MDKDNIGTIVVVDDDEDILYTLKEGLRFRLPSFKVKTATNSKDAIELIELSKPDLEVGQANKTGGFPQIVFSLERQDKKRQR